MTSSGIAHVSINWNVFNGCYHREGILMAGKREGMVCHQCCREDFLFFTKKKKSRTVVTVQTTSASVVSGSIFLLCSMRGNGSPSVLYLTIDANGRLPVIKLSLSVPQQQQSPVLHFLLQLPVFFNSHFNEQFKIILADFPAYELTTPFWSSYAPPTMLTYEPTYSC